MTARPRSTDGTSLVPADGTTLVESVVDDLPGGRALDIATGEGRVALTLAEHGWTVDAIDLSRSKLDQARNRAATRTESVDWILADVDSYCFPEASYDVIAVRFFDARDRLDDIMGALTSDGVLVYEHHLQSDPESHGSTNQYWFRPNELLNACTELRVRYYAEDRDRSRVWLVAARPPPQSIGVVHDRR